MRARTWLAAFGVAAIGAAAAAQGQQKHLNPMIELHMQKKPIFGLYAPSQSARARQSRRRRGRRPRRRRRRLRRRPPPKTPAELAKDALAYDKSDFVFDGSMERGVDPASGRSPSSLRVSRPPRHPRSAGAIRSRSRRPRSRPIRQRRSRTSAGSSTSARATIVLVDVESADEVKQGLAAMRFKSKGGTRPDDVGGAPAYWGMTEKEYRDKADLWPATRTAS